MLTSLCLLLTAPSQGGLIQTSLPTAMTRGQNRQLAGGTVLTFPKCKVYYDGKPSRQCILSFWAEKLVIENVSRGADLAAIPLSDVKELLVRTDAPLPILGFAQRRLTADPFPGSTRSDTMKSIPSCTSNLRVTVCLLNSVRPARELALPVLAHCADHLCRPLPSL